MNKDELRRLFREQQNTASGNNNDVTQTNQASYQNFVTMEEIMSEFDKIFKNNSNVKNVDECNDDSIHQTETDSIEPEPIPVVETLLDKAKQGDVISMLELGKCYFRGKDGYARSYKDAVLWFRKAAKKGNAEAQFRLGRCYEDGRGVKQSNSEAILWFELASKQNYPHAAERLERLKKLEKLLKDVQNGIVNPNESKDTLLVPQKKETPPPSYIKIEDATLSQLPVYEDLLILIRKVLHAKEDVKSSTKIAKVQENYGRINSNWYKDITTEVQIFYGVTPQLPQKARFEIVGDLIKYIIKEYDLKEKRTLPWWGKIVYIFPSSILMPILGKIWLEGKAKYNQIMLGLENTKWHEWGKKGDIRDAADGEVTWIYFLALVICVGVSLYYKYFLKDEINLENSIVGYFLKFALMMWLVSIFMQWWPCLVVAILEIVIRYYKFNKTDGRSIRLLVDKK